jgi:acetoin utilization deacetylase AcuC-like enzyme
MKIFYSDHFVLPLPAGHRFPMEKYARLRVRVIQGNITPQEHLLVPAPISDWQLRRVHTAEYVDRVKEGGLSREEVRRLGFPWSPALVHRARHSVGGTLAAALAALEDGWSANLAGGTHHAFADRGEGFCVFNDVAVAAREVQAEGRARNVAVLDLDVHQGNGTAAIFAKDQTVFTLSVHGSDNFPLRKETSDLDIELPDGTGDTEYLEAVERGVTTALRSHPDLAFYVAGADPYKDDRLGRLSVSLEGLAQRDQLVFDTCHKAGVPVAIVMSGGYARDVRDTVEIHYHTVRSAAERFRAAHSRSPAS